MGLRTLVTYLITTISAVGVGLLVVNMFAPGKGVEESQAIENRISYEIWVSQTEGVEILDNKNYLTNPDYQKYVESAKGKLAEYSESEFVSSSLKSAKQTKESGPLQFVVDMVPSNIFVSLQDNKLMSGGGICVQTEVQIGKDVMFGANSFITDTDFHPVAPENRRTSREGVGTKKVVIEDNVFIGMNTVVLKGVTIGKNSIVGANSTVVKNIPPNEIWGGSPAKFIKTL